jgi:hypothetical protein
MTMLALHAGGHFVECKLHSGRGVGCVATKTAQFVVHTHDASSRFRESSWRGTCGPRGQIQTFQFAVVTDAAFIQLTILL